MLRNDLEMKGKKKARLEENPRKALLLKCSNLNRQVLTPEIILYEILPWLPLESLFRFKLVCKEWNKAISSDSVLRATQCRKSMHHPPGLMYDGLGENTIFLDQSSKCTVMKHLNLIGSSNGLLCCSVTREGIEHFIVMNPITREGALVANSRHLADVTMAFEPSGCHPYFALVTRQVINVEYNVNGQCINTMGFTLYSSETRTWTVARAKVRIFRKSFRRVWGKSQYRSVYVGGKVYWKIVRDVFWFDIKEDSAGTVTVPNMGDKDPHGEIGDLNGELSYSTISAEDMVVWVLRADQEKKWVQKHRVLLTDIFKGISDNIPSCCKNAVLRLFKKSNKGLPSASGRRALPCEGGNLLFWATHGTSMLEGIVFSYNMETKALRIIHDSQMERWGLSLFTYKRSLASVPKVSSSTTA
ncbi:hypothetical protein ACHQM5_018215 [Ranunculus cassubicifolius]